MTKNTITAIADRLEAAADVALEEANAKPDLADGWLAAEADRWLANKTRVAALRAAAEEMPA